MGVRHVKYQEGESERAWQCAMVRGYCLVWETRSPQEEMQQNMWGLMMWEGHVFHNCAFEPNALKKWWKKKQIKKLWYERVGEFDFHDTWTRHSLYQHENASGKGQRPTTIIYLAQYNILIKHVTW